VRLDEEGFICVSELSKFQLASRVGAAAIGGRRVFTEQDFRQDSRAITSLVSPTKRL
jgi:hypothetical protein